MDLSIVVRYYIEKMLKDVTGMKAMILDSATTKIVSTVYSQSEILEQEVYLVESLESDPGEQLLHLKVGSEHRRLFIISVNIFFAQSQSQDKNNHIARSSFMFYNKVQ